MCNFKLIGYVQWSQKVSFRPETGPEIPQNEKNPKHFGTNTMVQKKICPTSIEKIFCLLWGGNFLFVSTAYMHVIALGYL